MKLLRKDCAISLRKIASLLISLIIIVAGIPLHALKKSFLASPGLQMLSTIESAENDQSAIEKELLGDPGVAQPEPFRIKVVEPIRLISRDERLRRIAEVGLNQFLLESDEIYIDLLTDSGTGAMSQKQMAAVMVGDETYAGSRSFRHMKETIQELLGFPLVLPAHQGRGAEQVFDEIMIQEGQVVPGNRIFDTSMAHIELRKGVGVQLPIRESMDTGQSYPFKGNVDLVRLREELETERDNVAYVLITITDNTGGGQPVSMENIKGARALAKEFGIPFIGDIARFAENAMFIKAREEGYNQKSIPEIVRETMDQFDAVLMSAKKDAMVPIGGFIAMRDQALYDKLVNFVIVREGFPTYGGIPGMIMEAMAHGLREVVQEDHLKYRLGQARYLGQKLKEAGIPIVEPVGGHAVFVDAKRFLPHIPPEQFPAQALVIMLYIEGGIRSVEIGTLLAGRDPSTGENKIADLELTRLTIPRRVYTSAHLDYIVEIFKRVWANRNEIRGLEMTFEPLVLRHFQGQFKWVEPAALESSGRVSLVPSRDGAGERELHKAM